MNGVHTVKANQNNEKIHIITLISSEILSSIFFLGYFCGQKSSQYRTKLNIDKLEKLVFSFPKFDLLIKLEFRVSVKINVISKVFDFSQISSLCFGQNKHSPQSLQFYPN